MVCFVPIAGEVEAFDPENDRLYALCETGDNKNRFLVEFYPKACVAKRRAVPSRSLQHTIWVLKDQA